MIPPRRKDTGPEGLGDSHSPADGSRDRSTGRSLGAKPAQKLKVYKIFKCRFQAEIATLKVGGEFRIFVPKIVSKCQTA